MRSGMPLRRIGHRVTLALAGAVALAATSCTTTYLGRVIFWNMSGIEDSGLFPFHTIAASDHPTIFPLANGANAAWIDAFPVPAGREASAASVPLRRVLEETGTTAFIVIQNGTLLYEQYLNGYGRDSVNRSFSVAKSFTSTLIGIAIDQGLIESVHDPITRYLPGIEGTNVESVTIENLLMMSTGWDYSGGPVPWTDDTILYYTPRVRERVLRALRGTHAPGEVFIYNNHNTYLLGMILEKVSGMTVAQFMERYLWRRIGAEFEATFSRNSESDTLDQVPSGLNARAIDFAKLGVLFLNGGSWGGEQVVSKEYVTAATTPAEVPDGYYPRGMMENSQSYKYQWWIRAWPEGGYTYQARGVYGQMVFVCPARDAVIARFGKRNGDFGSWEQIATDICLALD